MITKYILDKMVVDNDMWKCIVCKSSWARGKMIISSAIQCINENCTRPGEERKEKYLTGGRFA